MEIERMFVFIDESGVNKKIDYSCFAFVFINKKDYILIEKSILDLEKLLKIKKFHWKSNVWKIKFEFLKLISESNSNFKIKIIVNPIDQEKELEICFLDFIKDNKNNYIFIDGKKSKKYENKIKKYLKNNNISIKNIKTIKSDNSAGIKIADYVAGFFRYYFDNKGKIEKDFINIFNKILKDKVVELKKPQ